MTDFNPKDEFSAPKAFRYGGRAYPAGPVNKKEFKEEHLPILFKNGHIEAMSDDDALAYKNSRRDAATANSTISPVTGNTATTVALTDEQKARAQELVDSMSRDELNARAADLGVENPQKMVGKPTVAEAIVRAEG